MSPPAGGAGFGALRRGFGTGTCSIGASGVGGSGFGASSRSARISRALRLSSRSP